MLGHLSRDCNTPDLACGAIRTLLDKVGKIDMEVYCASQTEISPRFRIGETHARTFQPTFDDVFFAA